MARLKRDVRCCLIDNPPNRLTDRIRDGAIETQMRACTHSQNPCWLTDRIRDGAIETPQYGSSGGLETIRLTDRIRDGAIETLPQRDHHSRHCCGLPIGFAMARLKQNITTFTPFLTRLAYRSDSRWRD